MRDVAVEASSGGSGEERLALCFTGGGAMGSMYQVGAVAALEDSLAGFCANACDLFVGTSSGACVAAALAGQQPVLRLYRALLDPADDYFPLERKHVLQMDAREWRRTITSALRALSHSSRAVFSSAEASRQDPWQELSRLYDSLPAGLFSLEGFERFFETQLERRRVPTHFDDLTKELRIIAHELDTGRGVVFGSEGWRHVPIPRAVTASMAMPPLFTPVAIGGQHYLDPAPSQISHVDVAMDFGARRILVVNPLVPLRVSEVPTGHGVRSSLRDKGAMWVGNQANRIKVHSLLTAAAERARARGGRVLVVEPEPTDGTLFLHNAANFAARRSVLEFAYVQTCAAVRGWAADGTLGQLGLEPKESAQ